MPSFVYAHGQEYCQIAPKLIKAEPIDFGEYIIHPERSMSFIGDGRPHRSIEMKDGFALEYAGYHDLDSGCRLALFSVFGHQGFKQNGIFYCFRWIDKNNIFVLVSPIGGSRSIFPKRIDFVEQPDIPDIGPVQMSLF